MPSAPAKRAVNGADAAPDRALKASSAIPRRVGVFGGTFDPPHAGHVSVATDVADALGLDELVWIPAFRSPHKPDRPQTSAAIRLEMVRLVTNADTRFRVDDCEITREGPSYTVDTLRDMRSAPTHEDAEIVLIMGADQYAAFDRWREPDSIRRMATIAVMDRGGEAGPVGAGVCRVPVGRVDVSSTEIRERVARGVPIEGLVTEEVAAVIEREGLYREGLERP
jgi:nicotinate-nucleotide adenylyltransferase